MKRLRYFNVFDVLNVVILLLVAFISVYPFIYLASVSLSEASYVVTNRVTFYPKGINFDVYRMVLTKQAFFSGYKNTVIYTVCGTVLSMLLTVLCAYPLSKKHIPGIKYVTAMIVFTMFFSGGLIPTYLLVRALGMKNSIASQILPSAISVWNMIIVRTFFTGIAKELEEAAEIDGLNPIQILFRIVLPLSKPILAAISLFYALAIWNSWFPALIYLDDNDLFPVTLFIRNVLYGAISASTSGQAAEEFVNLSETGIRAASIMLVALPIIAVTPFIQKYLVKGVMIGSIKG